MVRVRPSQICQLTYLVVWHVEMTQLGAEEEHVACTALLLRSFDSGHRSAEVTKDCNRYARLVCGCIV